MSDNNHSNVSPPASPTSQPSSPTNQPAQPNQPNQTTQPNQPNQPNQVINEVIVEPGIQITNTQTIIPDVSVTTETTFNTTDPINHVPQISEDLTETVNYNYDDNVITESDTLVNEIKILAGQIQCSDFHGKGTIDDYSELFRAAANIANDTRQMQLDIDTDGFNDFGKAADDLSNLFINFTQRLQNVNIINDTLFLRAVVDALRKIYNLSEVFGRFKKTILVTSEIKVPKTAHDTKLILEGVMGEVNCAMNYINHFVVPDSNLVKANLSSDDKHIISKAVSTIDNWKVLCDQGVSIALTNSSDMSYLKHTNTELKQKTSILKSVTDTLKTKLSGYGCI